MTDYSVDGGAEDAGTGDILDNDIGVAVEFEGDEDDDDDDEMTELVVSSSPLSSGPWLSLIKAFRCSLHRRMSECHEQEYLHG